MAKKQKEQPVLTLDGEEYFAKDMSEEQLRIKDHLADLTNKLNTNVFIGEQLSISKESFINMFRSTLVKDDEDQPEKEAEVVAQSYEG